MRLRVGKQHFFKIFISVPGSWVLKGGRVFSPTCHPLSKVCQKKRKSLKINIPENVNRWLNWEIAERNLNISKQTQVFIFSHKESQLMVSTLLHLSRVETAPYIVSQPCWLPTTLSCERTPQVLQLTPNKQSESRGRKSLISTNSLNGFMDLLLLNVAHWALDCSYFLLYR